MTTGNQEQPHVFCFGLGYTAQHLATHLLAQGWRVSGTHRSMDACEAERAHGITAYLFDKDMPLSDVWDMQTITHLLISIPPDHTGDYVLQYHRNDIEQLPNLQWIGYLSTTGVYGDYQGEWVDETSPLHAATDRTVQRVDAEKAWIASTLPVHIFRLAGIYGPGRNALETVKHGTAKRIDKPGQYFSRIHVADIVQMLSASMARPNPPAIYNGCDDAPCPQADVVTYAAQLLAVEPPAFVTLEEAHLSEMGMSFYSQNRRVRNDKIKKELGVVLQYPTYREGLKALYVSG